MGNTKKDQFFLELFGIDQVNFDKKNLVECLTRSPIGLLPMTGDTNVDNDYTMCAAWQKNFSG